MEELRYTDENGVTTTKKFGFRWLFFFLFGGIPYFLYYFLYKKRKEEKEKYRIRHISANVKKEDHKTISK